MSSADLLSRLYSAAELAAMTGITPRRLRYYVREKLIDPPIGLGRGRHYDCGHLSQLRRVLGLRRAGLGHAAIRADAETLRRLLISKEYDATTVEFAAAIAGKGQPVPGKAPPSEPKRLVRLRMAPGIELLVDQEHHLPRPDGLLALAQSIRLAFGILDTSTPDNGGESAHLR